MLNKQNEIDGSFPGYAEKQLISPKLHTFEHLLDHLKGHAPDAVAPNKTILDFGVGKDGYAQFYAAHSKIAYGLDLYDVSDCYDNVTTILGDGKTIPLPDRSIDTIVSHSVLEHVEDLDTAFKELNRVLKVRGHVYFTVSPLYFSFIGSHYRELDEWQHLDPSHEQFMGQDCENNRIRGGFKHLNALTISRLLQLVGQHPWNILDMRRTIQHQPLKKIPDFLRKTDLNRSDLYTREFRLVCQKMWDHENDDPVFR